MEAYSNNTFCILKYKALSNLRYSRFEMDCNYRDQIKFLLKSQTLLNTTCNDIITFDEDLKALE